MSTNQNSAPGDARQGQAGGQAGTMTEDARQKAREVTDEAQQQARKMTDQVRQEARARGEEIRDQVEQKGAEQKDRMAGTAEALAEAIRSAGSTLRDRHEERLGQFTDEFADQVDRFSGYLRDHDMRGLMHDLENVARRNPAGFLGSTLAAGLVAGRFLRSSGRDAEQGRQSGSATSGQHRPPSHQEFASNSPTPEQRTPREAAGSSSPARDPNLGRETPYTAGGPRP